jgi:hypothetical protein
MAHCFGATKIAARFGGEPQPPVLCPDAERVAGEAKESKIAALKCVSTVITILPIGIGEVRQRHKLEPCFKWICAKFGVNRPACVIQDSRKIS